MNSDNPVGDLTFDDDPSIDDQVGPIDAHLDSFELHVHKNLGRAAHATFRERYRKGPLVHGLHEAETETIVDVIEGADDLPCELAVHQL